MIRLNEYMGESNESPDGKSELEREIALEIKKIKDFLILQEAPGILEILTRAPKSFSAEKRAALAETLIQRVTKLRESLLANLEDSYLKYYAKNKKSVQETTGQKVRGYLTMVNDLLSEISSEFNI